MGDDFAGLSLDELDELAQSVVTCLEVNPEDPGCLADAYKVSRGALDLVESHRFLSERLQVIRAQLELVRAGRQS